MWEQKWFLITSVPFMFMGAVGDFLFPDLIGKVVNAMKEQDKDEIFNQLMIWLVVICVGAVGTMCNSVLSGVTAERIGNSLRQKLFDSLIKKDTAFFDSARTGDLCKYFLILIFVVSRLNADTEVVQAGLSTSVAMFVKGMCTCLAMVIIMFTYTWKLTIYALLLITPTLFGNRIFMNWM